MSLVLAYKMQNNTNLMIGGLGIGLHAKCRNLSYDKDTLSNNHGY